MKINKLKHLALTLTLMTASSVGVSAECLNLNTQAHTSTISTESTFGVGDGTFLLNGNPFLVKAGEVHYARIPREYWDHRIKMTKALGMNTVCLYVFWNVHESRPDEVDFTGQNDVREFIKLCDANGMKVIVRPGPYICSEWDMGGLPWWLLKKKDIRLREQDPYFMERVDKFQGKIAEQIADLTIDKGGPIIMVQVENEYGAYGTDKPYIAAVRDILRKYYGDITLFQCDWSSNFKNNALDDLIWTINFGTGANIDHEFKQLKQMRPNTPLMCSEFWSGWFDKWGARHETKPADKMVAGIDEMLSKGISFSLYMAHGGTNWGHWAGSNSPGFSPDVSSYDYDAPISESGEATPKYHQLRQTLSKYMDGEKLAKIPDAIKTITVPTFSLTEYAPLFENLPEAKRDRDIRTMEEYDQGYGSILYRTTLPELTSASVLHVNDAHDYAQIFIDGKYIGSLDRRNAENAVQLPPCEAGAQLDILVEAMGRINFGRAIKDFKGITGSVTVTENRRGYNFVCDVKNWEVFNFEDVYPTYANMKFQPISGNEKVDGRYPRGVYRGTFQVNKPGDTFLNFETWGKGLVYVNGYPLGRIWEIGPQQTLYMPGCWLKKGENEIMVFDIVGPSEIKTEGLRQPIVDKLNMAEPLLHRKEGDTLNLSNVKPVATGSFKPGNGWQEVKFGAAQKGRYLCIEALNAINGREVASIAELYALDDKGERLSREPWKVYYADSESLQWENLSATKVFDLQESTKWSTVPGVPFPHAIVIDLGDVESVSGIQYLPRMESNTPGAIKDYNIYLSEQPFEL